MSTNILFIFEGARAEEQIVENLQKSFFAVKDKIITTSVYGAEIYQIYKEISADEDLDTFNLIKARNPNKEKLRNFVRNDFAEIFMFFDYEGHSPTADDEKLKELLEFFNNETDKGKLYISYPMVESLKHISCHASFRDLNVICKEKIDYKNIVTDNCLKELQDLTRYDINTWKQITETHLKKMNYIVFDLFEFPQKIVSQDLIFSRQIEKYISNEKPTVAVLSAFPVFIHDYYGNQRTRNLIY